MIYAFCAYLSVAIGYAVATLPTQLDEIDRCEAIRGENIGPIIRTLTIIGTSLTWPVPACMMIARLIEIGKRRSRRRAKR